ncbi:docking protein 2-like [Mantella aurantiaca]
MLCSLAFPQERRCLERSGSQPLPSEGLQLQENSLYSTSQEASPGQFAVRVRQTEASSRCGLSGVYTLVAESKCLLLRDRQKSTLLYSWPYPYLRRFGRDKTMFSFEAGRRCTSGEGNFEFETSFGSQIFQAIECAIKAGHNEASSPTGHEQHHEDLSAVPKQPARSVSLTVSASLQPPLCPQNKVTTNPTIPESEYAIPFDKVAQNLLATGFGGLLGPSASAQKPRKPQKPENIYDEPEVPINPVYDEPEVIRVDAWKMQATDAHEMGYEYPYLPGWDDYAVPRSGGKMPGRRGQDDEDEWGKKARDEREYDNLTLRGVMDS